MYRGRWQLGNDMPVSVRTVTAAGVPTAPTACPAMIVTSAAGGIVVSRAMPIHDRYGLTGYFQDRVRLNHAFTTGRYYVNYVWVISGTVYGDVDVFEVVAGGNADGTAIASHFYDRPHADFIVQQLDSGQVVYGRNPKV